MRIERQRLTIETVDSLSDDMCTICQSPFQARQYVIDLSCGHGYHEPCFIELVQQVRLPDGKAFVPELSAEY